MEPAGSLYFSQQTIIGTYPKLDGTSPHSQTQIN
jgi:hypothetical protein